MDEQVQRITDNIWANVIVTLLGLGGFSLFLVSLVSRILKPLQEMTIAAERLSQGATDFELQVRTKDELEVLANAFNEVGRSIQEKKKVAQEIAKNNLKIWVPLRSEEDELGVALIQMRQGIYESISELTQYSELMYQESDNLSAINETLASGASESAAALEDITNAVKTLNERNRKNTESAREAEQLTTGAKEEANQGSQKMTKMVDSMDTITKGSDEIKKIIRVIDDIAFQTNLLALNAAVEAARAGTHGKGFAVVAEEVRNLASRSAKAAQETAELIEESIRQVTSGNQIAEDTSHSLNTITQNVLTITETIGHIAGESERQTMEISSITTAVSQASVAAHETMHKMTDAAETMKSIANTAEKLDAITKRFQFNPDGSTDAPFEAKHIIGSTHKRRNV